RRADRLARPRYRRLGAQLSRGLPRPHRCNDPFGLAQHGRGRAVVRAGAGDEGGTYRRSRQPRGADRPLRPDQLGGSVFADRPRACRRAGAGVVTAPVGGALGRNPSPPFRGEREGPIAARWEGEVGLLAGLLESPTSPRPSPPPWAERG